MSTAFISRKLRQCIAHAIPSKRLPQSSLISTSATAFSTLPQKDQEKGGRSTWSKLLLFIPGAITFGLGTWQIFRRQDKLLDYRQSRLADVPLKGNEIVASTWSTDSLEFRKVQCKGVFDEKKSIYVGPRSRSISGVTQNGYYVITPLIPVPGDPESLQSSILVNRGWVPRSWRDKALNSSKGARSVRMDEGNTNPETGLLNEDNINREEVENATPEPENMDAEAMVNNDPVPPDGWTFRRPSMQGITYKVNHYCKEDVLILIRTTLQMHGDEGFNRFANSCFGKFYDFPGKLGKSMSTIHEIMTYQVEKRMTEDYVARELNFYINNELVRFGRKEFALITGLNFGGSTFDPQRAGQVLPIASMYAIWYQNRRVTHGTLADDFKDNRFNTVDEFVKAAKILFVYGVLLGVPKSQRIVDWIWVLAEDEEAWEAFPWGRFSYQHLIHCLNGIRTEKIAEGKIQSYHLSGFMTAFLCWIFCAFPEVGKQSGLLMESSIPRILRFEYLSGLGDVLDLIVTIKKKLKPSEDEKETQFWQSIEDGPFLVNFPKYEVVVPKIEESESDDDEESDGDGDEDDDGKGDGNGGVAETPRKKKNVFEVGEIIETKLMNDEFIKRLANATTEVLLSKLPKMLACSQTQHRAQNMNSVEEGVDDGDHQLTQTKTADGSGEGGIVQSHESEEEQDIWRRDFVIGGTPKHVREALDPHEYPESVAMVVENVVGAPENGGVQVEEEGYRTPIHKSELDNVDETFLRLAEDSAHAVTQVERMKKRKEKGKEIDMGKAEIIEQAQKKGKQMTAALEEGLNRPKKMDWTFVRQRRQGRALCSPFLDNEKRGGDYAKFKKSSTTRNVGLPEVVAVDWFAAIEDELTELNTDQMEAYLCCLNSFPSYAGLNHADEKIGLTSIHFVPKVYDIWLHYHSGEDTTQCDPNVGEAVSIDHLYELASYVYGEEPQWKNTKKWFSLDKIGSAFMGIDGWAAYELDLKTNTINIYDARSCSFKANDYKDQAEIMFPLSRILPQLLLYSGFYDARPELKQQTQWRVNNVEKQMLTIKNPRPYIAGGYALKYVECLMSRRFPTSYNKKDMTTHLKMVAKSIFRFSTDGSTQPKKVDG